MKKTYTFKKVTAVLLASAIAITTFCIPGDVNAAEKKKSASNNSSGSYRTLFATDLEVNKRKVGGKYFSYDGESYLVQTSLKKNAASFTTEISGAQITTNGKYAYYQDGENGIVQTKLSKNSTSTVIKDPDAEVTHVYHSSVYYQKDNEKDSTTIYCYNAKKKKTKVITSTAEDISICAAGRYIVYGDTETNELKIRDCSKGKNKVITKLNASYAKTDGKKVLYLVYNEEKDQNELMSYNIKKKTNTLVTVIESYESAAAAYDLNTFAYESDGNYYKYDLKTKKTTSIKAEEYQTY